MAPFWSATSRFALAAIFVAAALIVEGGILIKRSPPNPPIMTIAIGMTVGAPIPGIASLASGAAWIIPTQTNTWLAYLYLVIFVTIVAFLLFMIVLANGRPRAHPMGLCWFPW